MALDEAPVRFHGPAGSLAGLLHAPSKATRAVVVCHPHPHYGGDMRNRVVRAVVEALGRSGVATLRFDFRGVGESDGGHAGGAGEAEDASAAVGFVAERLAAARITLAGYSFGAAVALRAGRRHPRVERLVAIAPPLGMIDPASLAACGKPALFLAGDRDPFCEWTALERLARGVSGATLRRLAGADHFLGGVESRAGEEVVRFVESERSDAQR